MSEKGAFFEGWYFKHQIGSQVFSFIISHHREITGEKYGWIQMITPSASYFKKVGIQTFYENSKGLDIWIDGISFSLKGIVGKVDFDGCLVSFDVKYEGITPLKEHVMGPFRFMPAMECRHDVYSLTHKLDGFIQIDGVRVDVSGGTGYIEGDKGHSFPKSYFWSQCNFGDNGEHCVVVAVADIPLPVGNLHFQGNLCEVYYKGEHYRLATYHGAKVLMLTPNYLLLQQGKYKLQVSIIRGNGHLLKAPKQGKMSRHITEKPACKGRYTFYEGEKMLFDIVSDAASGEYYQEEPDCKV